MNNTLSKELTPRDIELVLQRLGIEPKGRTDANGWITIKSPLRDERNPSFGINLQTGAWKDHGTDESGDLVTLVERVNNMDTTSAIQWIKEETNLSGALYSPPKNGAAKSEDKQPQPFWNDSKINKLSDGQERLQNNPDHPVIQQAKQYDCLSLNTLQYFGVGLITKWQEDWLAFPYKTGVQLYRRADGDKVIRSLKGSKPALSFFGSRKVTGDKNRLLLAKSPREAMLLWQSYSHRADVIGLATGEQGKLTNRQRSWLKSQISDAGYIDVTIILDCDSEAAYNTAKELAYKVQKIAGGAAVSVVNLYESSGGEFKDVTDCKRAGMSNELLLELLQNGESIEVDTKTESDSLQVQPDDLRLDDSLIDLLPPVVKNYLTYSAPLSDVPNEFLLTPFLATAGAAIGKKRYVDLGGIQVYPTIWTVLFAGSSTLRKSTALSMAKKPFKPIEEHYRQKYESELLEWEQRRDNAEMNGESFDEPEPIKKTIYAADGFSDLTFWEGLRDNESQISNVGEFTALWSELTRPRNSMRDLALSIFDAEDSIRRHTKSAGDIELQNPVWCMAGATTLTNFQRTLTSTERASGLLQRILPVCMEQRTKEYKALTELQRPDAELYHHITDQTVKLIDLERRAVSLTPDARERFTTWSHNIHSRAEQLSERLSDIGGYVSRLEVYAMKFALIFQQLHRPEQAISNENMRAAIALAEWLLNHILYMLDRNYIFNRHYADRVKIRELLEKQPDGKMSRTDLMNMSHFDKEQLDRAVNSEIEAGKIEEHKTDTGGVKPRIDYELTDGA